MADVKYPDSVPVDEPVAKKAKPPAPKPPPKSIYPDSVPVDEPVKKMAKGGSASSRADGIAQRGKTRGTMIMCGGGMAKGKR
jgi:hypothetical protein